MTEIEADARPLRLSALLTGYDSTRALRAGLVRSDLVALDYHESPTVHENFRPLIRGERFDVAELALVSQLQAFAAGKDLALLPFVMNARLQHDTLVCDAARPVAPQDLRGRRIAVRAYAQTTVAWVRGILHHDHGVAPEDITWVVQGPGHVEECPDPAWCVRAPAGMSIPDLLHGGHAEAAILAPKFQTPGMRPVIGNVAGVALDWHRRTGLYPINHMAVVRRRLVEERPDAVREIWRMLTASRVLAPDRDPNLTPFGFAALAASVQAIADFSYEAAVLPRRLAADELFADAARVLSGRGRPHLEGIRT